MDRLNRILTGCGLTLLLAAGGCRSTQPEVPPGRAYNNDGRQNPPIGFSSDAHPSVTGPGITNGMPGMAGAPGAPQLGTPGPGRHRQVRCSHRQPVVAAGTQRGMAPMPASGGEPEG